MNRHPEPYAIADLLPQQPPMRLLDRILATDGTMLWSLINISADSPFAGAEGVPSHVALEYLAQSAAAFFSLKARATSQAEPQPPQPGMLLACSTLTARTPYFSLHQQLVARVTPVTAVPGQTGGLVRFRGEVACFAASSIQAPDISTLQASWPQQPAVAAELSVWLPPTVASTAGTQRAAQ